MGIGPVFEFEKARQYFVREQRRGLRVIFEVDSELAPGWFENPVHGIRGLEFPDLEVMQIWLEDDGAKWVAMRDIRGESAFNWRDFDNWDSAEEWLRAGPGLRIPCEGSSPPNGLFPSLPGSVGGDR